MRLALTLVGAAVTAGAYWALLNVPESNALALTLSALLAVLVVALAGMTTAVVLSHAEDQGIGATLRQAPRRLPMFLVGAMVFCVLWWITTSIESQWTLHRGEIDALFLRYAGTAKTSAVHTTVSWLLWLVRWGLGLAIVVAATAGRPTLALSLRPLAITVLALAVGWALALGVYWRPRTMSGGVTELAFVALKLGSLTIVAAALVVAVLGVFATHARRT
ncbi:MAG: hypothetical protein QM736_15290 [Vicinamibacterales bacterium]